MFVTAPGHWQQECPSLLEAIWEQGRCLRESALRRTTATGLHRPDAIMGPVTAASRNAGAAAAAAAVAVAARAGHRSEVDFIHALEVNTANVLSSDGVTTKDEGYSQNARRSAAEETGTDGEASTEVRRNIVRETLLSGMPPEVIRLKLRGKRQTPYITASCLQLVRKWRASGHYPRPQKPIVAKVLPRHALVLWVQADNPDTMDVAGTVCRETPADPEGAPGAKHHCGRAILSTAHVVRFARHNYQIVATEGVDDLDLAGGTSPVGAETGPRGAERLCDQVTRGQHDKAHHVGQRLAKHEIGSPGRPVRRPRSGGLLGSRYTGERIHGQERLRNPLIARKGPVDRWVVHVHPAGDGKSRGQRGKSVPGAVSRAPHDNETPVNTQCVGAHRVGAARPSIRLKPSDDTSSRLKRQRRARHHQGALLSRLHVHLRGHRGRAVTQGERGMH